MMMPECTHPALVQAKMSGDPLSDEQIRVYFCINPNCAKPVLTFPVNKFDDNTEALEYLRKIVSEIEIPKLNKPPTHIIKKP